MRLILVVWLGFPIASWSAPVVSTLEVKKAEIHDLLSYPARVESSVNATIFADADGVVTKISKSLGEKAKSGQVILTVRHIDPIFQYAPMKVLSPVTGVVSAVKVTEGSRVSKGQHVASVTDPSSVRVVIEVAALDMKFFKSGVEGEFKSSGNDKPLVVKVRGVSPFVDPSTGTATAELILVNPAPGEFSLAPGLLGQVSFKVNQRVGILVPEHALTYKGKAPFVRVVQQGKSKRVAVNLGKKQRGQVEITSGVKEGDQVIERTSGYVSDGEEVKVENAQDDSAKVQEK